MPAPTPIAYGYHRHSRALDQPDHTLRLQETAQQETAQREATRGRWPQVRSGSCRSRLTRGGEVDDGFLSADRERAPVVPDTAQVGNDE